MSKPDEERIRFEEGYVLQAYVCPAGKWSTGIGMNLERAGAAEACKAVGVDHAAVMAACKARERQVGAKIKGDRTPKAVITAEQAEALFANDMAAVRRDIVKLVPNFAEHSAPVQGVLLDMLYNMGFKSLSAFAPTLALIIEKRYVAAANRITNTPYYKVQVPKRAARNVAILCAAQANRPQIDK